jgi:hypothetical protein
MASGARRELGLGGILARLPLSIAVAACLSGCADLPQRGFLTRYVAGPDGHVLPKAFETPNSFDGTRTFGPMAIEDSTYDDPCELAARERANDTYAQGFDADTQEQVYRATLSDCRIWSARH